MKSATATSMRCFRAVEKRYLQNGPQYSSYSRAATCRGSRGTDKCRFKLESELRQHKRPSTTFSRAFSVQSSSECDEKDNKKGHNKEPTTASEGNASIQKGEFNSPFLGPCYGQLAVTPTPRGYAFEVLLQPRQENSQHQQHQQRQYSQSSPSSGTGATPSNPEPPGKDTAEARKGKRRLKVYYPYNDIDIRRKQKIRKEQKRKRTIRNVNRALFGNVVIAGAKLCAWFSSQSSSMMSEFVHSVVDCANQYLLLQGLRDSSNAPDRKHPYGYGKSVYFWALVSALGTFFMGCGVSMSHAVRELMNPSLHEIGPEVLGVLAFSFAVDGYVLTKTVREVQAELPPGVSMWAHMKTMRDPATLAILLEDGAACLGVLLAIAGTTASHYTGTPIYDGLAGCGISILLGTMGFTLARMNYRFLLGQSVDKNITDNIEKILKSRKSIDSINSVQSQWTGPDTFSYKAEVGFDGTFLAAKLMSTHEKEFFAIRDSMEKDLSLVLSWYAEDVIRTVEREVRIIEAQVRQRYPAAEYIELEPMSKDSHEFAIDDSFEKELVRIESKTLEDLRKWMPALESLEGGPSGAPISPDSKGKDTAEKNGPSSSSSSTG